ncbi:zinc finger protein 76-like isoform X3 [Cryptotermes secundus]|uniref:zinc finger protein 76-like isoform X3 n=1 Tax=Cryptotermes secundus TaxID=105785 RepID=UPI000CD7BA2D|nr:zinc finger protein 76-like isoform X3 [Cryptotermes secundus]
MAASEEPKEDNMMLLISDNVVRKEDSQIRKIHSCPYKYCERSFNRPWRLASHVRSHTGQRSHPCEVPGCKKAYFNSSHLRRHMTTSHRAESLLKTLLKCPHPSCIVELSSSCSLKRHCWRIHERQHLFTCTNCDRGFSRQSQWQAHLYEHTGVPPFMCSTCQLGFINQRDFNRHNRRHAKNYLCEVSDCGKHFECYTHLLRHTTLHHPTEFVCDVCNKSFKAKCRLLTHMSVHQESSQREMLSCPYSNCARSQKNEIPSLEPNLGCEYLAVNECCRKMSSHRTKEDTWKEMTHVRRSHWSYLKLTCMTVSVMYLCILSKIAAVLVYQQTAMQVMERTTRL